MKKPVIALVTLTLLVIVAVGSMGIRAFYIAYLTDSAAIRVINYSPEKIDVSLTFPSKENRIMTLDPKSYEDFQIGGTGEGSISIEINERESILTGYVTSINPPMLISIGNDFSVEFDYIKRQNQSH
jgi:hypothetical protein